jgi:hypothetical protein
METRSYVQLFPHDPQGVAVGVQEVIVPMMCRYEGSARGRVAAIGAVP